jgi:hypothetical protein
MLKKLELLAVNEDKKIAKLSELIRTYLIGLEIPEVIQTSIKESLNLI